MASKAVIVLLALLSAVLILQVAVAEDEVAVDSGESSMMSREPDLDVSQDEEVVVGQSDATDLNVDDAEFDDSTVEDPAAATDDPDAASDNDDEPEGDEQPEATDLVDQSAEGGDAHETGHLLARILWARRSIRCSKRKQCKKLYKQPGCCKKKCVNLLSDRNHCGKCGHMCNTKRGYVCKKGYCRKLKKHECPSGKVRCKRICKDLRSDSRNCGKCGKKCKKGSLCCKGSCISKESYHHCGKCGHKCHFGHKCCGGKCTNVLKDQKNCGRCAKKCKSGVTCSLGLCGYGN